MKKVVVTGAAGFLGSHLCERLLNEGYTVTGIDSFTDFYDPARKRAHLARCLADARFTLVEEDLNLCDLGRHLADASCVFHLAAQAGVRRSWGAEFSRYVESNVLATQRLLEALRAVPEVKLVHSSSSSVYGEPRRLPMDEDHPAAPISPYGATKLSAEQLCELYRVNFDLRYTALRYFTVYGPRQRPDMAFSRFIAAALGNGGIEVYGDGSQTRDFTYVLDAVDANIRALDYAGPERVFNIGGGSRASIMEVLETLERLLGGKIPLRFLDPAKGDVTATWADTSRARAELGFDPRTSLEAGLRAEIDWYRDYPRNAGRR